MERVKFLTVPTKPRAAMSLVKKFLESDVIKGLKEEGNEERIGQLAISMGTIGRDNELRAYGAKILDSLSKTRRPGKRD